MKKFEAFDAEDPFGEESKPKEGGWSGGEILKPERRPRPVPPPLEIYHYDTTMTIGNPINPPFHRNTFKIKVRCMHGDGDAYTTKTIYEETKEVVIRIYNFLKWARRADFNLYSRMWNLAFPNDEDGLFDILSRDATSNGEFWASPNRVTVTYFDDKGIEYEVNFNQLF